MTEFMAV